MRYRSSAFRGLAYSRKGPISFVLAVRVYQRGFHWMDLHQTRYWGLLWKYVEEIPFWLKSDNNSGCFAWRPISIFDRLSLSSSYKGMCFRQTLWRISKYTHCVLNSSFPRNLCRLWVNSETARTAVLPSLCKNGYGNALRCVVRILSVCFSTWGHSFHLFAIHLSSIFQQQFNDILPEIPIVQINK